MLGTILGLLTGLAGPLATVSTALSNLYTEYKRAETDTKKAEIQSQIAEVEGKKAVLVAEAGSRLGTFINGTTRTMAAIGPITYVTKLLLWDKVIGSFVGCRDVTSVDCSSFSTDPIDANTWYLIIGCYAFYFLYASWRSK